MVNSVQNSLLSLIFSIATYVRDEGLAGCACDLQFTCNLLICIGSFSDHFTAKQLFSLVKDETLNQRVPGSSPGAPTIQDPAMRVLFISTPRTKSALCEVLCVGGRGQLAVGFPLFPYRHPFDSARGSNGQIDDVLIVV
jgi:hypothetical protein